MTGLREIVSRLNSDPRSLLTDECVLALGAFLSGYRHANGTIGALLARLTERFPGPEQAAACTRAYLTMSDTRAALQAVLSALGDELSHAEAAGVRAAGSALPEHTFVEALRGAIVDGRPCMFLREPTVVCMADYGRGYVAGITSVDPVSGASQELQLRQFESWLRTWYGGLHAPWYGLIRVHEGACELGLRRFLELWDSFTAELAGSAASSAMAPR